MICQQNDPKTVYKSNKKIRALTQEQYGISTVISRLSILNSTEIRLPVTLFDWDFYFERT